MTHGTQRLDGHGQGELLAQKSIHEAPATDFAAIFKPAEAREQLAPGRKISFARQQIAEDDAVTSQKHPAGCFDRSRFLRSLAGVQQSPAAGAMAGSRNSSASLPRAPFGIDERAQIVESVSGDQACRHKLPQSGFDFRLQFATPTNNVGEERCPPLPQKIEHQLRRVT